MSAMTDELVELAWAQIWQVTVLAIAVAIVVCLAGRTRPHLAYLLWMLVIVKCLTLPLWSSSVGVFSWAQLRVASVDPLAELLSETATPAVGSTAPAVTHPLAEVPDGATRTALPALLAAIWVAGIFVVSIIVLVKWARCRELIRSSSVEADWPLQRVLQELSQRFGLRCKARLLVTSSCIGPAVFGWWRPTIVLPRALLAAKSAKDIEPILAHELVHVRRADTLAGRMQLFAQVMWWFHPLIWWANREGRRARERCADEEVVASLKCRPTEYARGLLDAAELLGSPRQQFLSAGVHLSHVTAKRVEEIMNHADRFQRRTPLRYWLLLMVAGVVVLPGAGLRVLRGSSANERGPRPAESRYLSPAETNREAVAKDENESEPRRNNEAGARREDTEGDEAEAVTALKDLGAVLKLNNNGQVIDVRLRNNPKVTDAHLEHLKKLPRLQTIYLIGVNVTDRGLVHLKTLREIETLVLESKSDVTDAGIAQLKDLPKLRELGARNTQLGDEGLRHLKEISTLERLWLAGTQLSDAGLDHLKGLSNLKILGIGNTKITNAGLQHLKGITSLEILLLQNTAVSDDGLEHLKGLHSLRTLGLTDTKVTDAGLEKHVKAMTNLEDLFLPAGITNEGLRNLKGLKNLEGLELSGTQVTDEGLVHLKDLKRLEWLWLNNIKVSDDGLEHLKALKTLKELYLQNTKVNLAGVNQLKQALPNCKIQFP